MLLGVALLIVLVGVAAPAWRGDRQAAVMLAAAGAAWLYVDKWFEGPILIRFGYHHGLVLADLVGLAALGMAAVCLYRSRDAARVGRRWPVAHP